MLPGALMKMTRRGGKWTDLLQRLGLHDDATRAAIGELPLRRFWMHAVSVGEVNVARKLIARLLADAPDAAVVLTTPPPTRHGGQSATVREPSGRPM